MFEVRVDSRYVFFIMVGEWEFFVINGVIVFLDLKFDKINFISKM